MTFLCYWLQHSDCFRSLVQHIRYLEGLAAVPKKVYLQLIRYTIFFTQNLAWNTKDILLQNSVNIWFLKSLLYGFKVANIEEKIKNSCIFLLIGISINLWLQKILQIFYPSLPRKIQIMTYNVFTMSIIEVLLPRFRTVSRLVNDS